MSDLRLVGSKLQTACENLNKVFADLRSKDEKVRAKALVALRGYVSDEFRDMSGETFSKFLQEVNKRISELVSSSDIQDKVTAITAIDELIDADFGDDTTRLTRFPPILRNVLPHPDINVMMMASKAVGHLAKIGGMLTAEFVDFEVKRALEWLEGDRYESRRHAAVLILKELAENAGTLFFVHVEHFFEHMWTAIRDPKINIRETAVEALRACLRLIEQRNNPEYARWYQKIKSETYKNLDKGNNDTVHGSLLVLGELFINSGNFLVPYFKEASDYILKFRDHRDKLVKKTVVTILPKAISFAVSKEIWKQEWKEGREFYTSALKNTIQYVFKTLNKEGDRSYAFIAMGEIALAIRSDCLQYLDEIMARVKEGLGQKAKKVFVVEAIHCVRMLSQAIGTDMKAHVAELLDILFQIPLSQVLIDTFGEIARHIPDYLGEVQDRLLNRLSMILSSTPYRQFGTPSYIKRFVPPTPTPNAPQNVLDTSDPETIVLALRALRSFNFTGHFLLDFCRDSVMKFIDDENSLSRREACLTCCTIASQTDNVVPTRGHAALVISELLSKLMNVMIADQDSSIRYDIINSLDARFDYHLAQAENLRLLFIAMNDEIFEVREKAVITVGRLTARNPAYVMPSLRKTLIQLLTELDMTNDTRVKVDCTKLLGKLISSSHRLVKPYVDPILHCIMPKLKDTTQDVGSSALAVVGELSRVAGEDMLKYIDELMPQIVETLQDQSSSVKREIALRTLGQLVESTGYTITPYMKYPNLMNIILQMFNTETLPTIRTELLKVTGILGALDPYKHKMNQLELQGRREAESPQTRKAGEDSTSSTDILQGLTPSSEDYYPAVAISSLMKILRDSSLSVHHQMVIQTIMLICKSLSMKCVTYLPQIMPVFLQVLRASEHTLKEVLFSQMGLLVPIVKQHIRKYVHEIIVLIKDNWNMALSFQIVCLIEELSIALADEFKIYLSDLIPMMLNALVLDRQDRRTTQKVLHAFEVFGTNLDDYLHLVLPALVRLLEQTDLPIAIRINTIQTIARLSRKLNFSAHISRIIHPLVRIIDQPFPELRKETMEAICTLIHQIGTEFLTFSPLVERALTRNRFSHPRYEQHITRLQKNMELPPDQGDEDRINQSRAMDESMSVDTNAKKPPVNQNNLKRAWEVSQRSTKEDWAEWIRRFSVELLRESSSPALRSCAALAQVYHPLSRELFNAGFVSCWTDLYEQNQESLVNSLTTALTSPHISSEILQILLNLAEFMEQDDKALPIEPRILGSLAEKCHAYAKALHYKELEFHSSPDSLDETIQALISINNQLQQPEAAMGVLQYAQQSMGKRNFAMESWYEKLHQWEDALAAYQKKRVDEPYSSEITVGMMRCYNALGEWQLLSKLTQETWRVSDIDVQRNIAPFAASAAWNLGLWDQLETYTSVMDGSGVEGSFFRAIVALHSNQFTLAESFIQNARSRVDADLTALIGESYDRAYNLVVRVQQLSELEEVMNYMQSADLQDRRTTIKKLWNERLKGGQRNVEVWQQILAVRSLVVSPQEDVEIHLKFAALCRKSGRLHMSNQVLLTLLNKETQNLPSNNVGFAYIKNLWSAGSKGEALEKLKNFVTGLRDDHGLQARCYLKLGHWIQATEDAVSDASIAETLSYYKSATQFKGDWYKAWHSWALINYEVVKHQAKSTQPKESIKVHVVQAVHGLFRSISLSRKGSSNLQDTLRLLTLWFQYGAEKEVETALIDGFNTVSIDTWLKVVPQLIARIHTGVLPVRRLIHNLLTIVGKEHPQALVYPLTVASKSQSETRRDAALAIMNDMKQHSMTLVDQSLLVSQELIRVAILWHEMWHEGLEEASRLYFGDHNVEGMFAVLKPLHEMLEKGPETMKETAFQQAYGRDLHEALEWCRKFQRSNRVSDINQAWDLYYHVFRRINKQLPTFTTLELQYVSPLLQKAESLQLAVPGTYKVGDPVVKIQSFSPTLHVITSKQRPRKLMVHGSNGNEYYYLLKGHEDLRQDERAMQLFGLVNTLLANESETAKKHLSIQRYAIIPLSPNSGIIGWVPHCDTLHALIRDYRDSRKIVLNIEHRLMLQMAPDYDNLSLIQKVEVFDYALENTTGKDLHRVLWLKSRNSEVWLDRRTNYTKSLAVMSMVGYILGLGDRHPSNLMMDRYTGKVLHIDFGDCFEVAMHREKFPEKIPFRLTRMLIQAMEVSGIEGNFRYTCESVMRVLRENKESLMAVLEAFVHDPLINWRLLNSAGKQDKKKKQEDVIHADPAPAPSPHVRTRLDIPLNIANENSDYPVLNERAVAVVSRVQNKLTGRDFANEVLDVHQQVDRLIQQATSHENLCQCYVGWCPFW
eukprot:TRINITY_DN1288_c0_g1_i6.p1 TRINITY_DN1288_c0_g1~~TRINITY_DN1288_c0_g1_i6.p1  ORF type:complete len:2340 (-),score=509.17 TRINITY_DN1288_c0_g1_i6:204-7223(-)